MAVSNRLFVHDFQFGGHILGKGKEREFDFEKVFYLNILNDLRYEMNKNPTASTINALGE